MSIVDYKDGAGILAPQWSGVVRALSTLAQLVKAPKVQGGFYSVPYTPIDIEDYPRYPYRGLMLDTARRYYTVDSILQIMDAMHIAKFNVLHWHLVEDESFPLELKTFQNVHKNAAFKQGETYSRAQVKQIVDHAQRLAIRVVPEFDNPGHSRAIGLDPYFTEIVRCFNKTDVYTVKDGYDIKGTPLSAPLDPSMDKTYEYI